MRERRLNEFRGVVLVAVGIIVLASLASFTPYDLSFYTSHPNVPPKNFTRIFGAYLAYGLVSLFGWSSYLIPLLVLYTAVRLFRQQKPNLRLPRMLGIIVLIVSSSSLVGMLHLNNEVLSYSRAGFLGFILSKFVATYFGKLGGYVLFVTLIILSAALVAEILVSTLLLNALDRSRSVLRPVLKFKSRIRLPVKPPVPSRKPASVVQQEAKSRQAEPVRVAPAPAAKLNIQIKAKQQAGEPAQDLSDTKPAAAKAGVSARDASRDNALADYRLPSLDLLDIPAPLEVRQIKEDLANNARVLEETLGDFGISVKVTDVERGPVITRYELEPAPGVKLNRIVALCDDIALAMKAQSVRIVAPIPGKARVGIEVPNMQSSFVYLREVLGSKEYQASDSKLTLALGKDITGQAVVSDLGEMPHLLIAGTTGSGKTVCVNSLILSMLFKCGPSELKLIMVDPKMVELAPFNGLPHLLCPVVTDAKKASVALAWTVNEMEERYRILARVGARNIEAYNEKQEKIPYIIVIIDELADLMNVARDQIENAITRLAQLSRAVGIHLILATQRPSVDVITGVIKANFPARISFKVASKVDSRTVLDTNGADKLLGKGDMLFLRPGEAKLIRAQGTLLTDAEIEKVCGFIKSQGVEPVFDEEILKEQQKSALAGAGQKDEVYEEAVRVIMESNQASVSILQRRMRLGYTRAARIIDMMEQEGLVGPFEGSKPRRILVDREPWINKGLGQEEEV